MGTYPSVAAGGAAPLHVADAGIGIQGDGANLTIGRNLAGTTGVQVVGTNLVLLNTNLVGIGAADAFLSRQGVGVILTSRLQSLAADESAVVGAAGAAAALPAQPLGYKILKSSGGGDVKIPYYNP